MKKCREAGLKSLFFSGRIFNFVDGVAVCEKIF